MKANELRIWNWIYSYDMDTKPAQITSIYNYKNEYTSGIAISTSDNDYIGVEALTAIPLTPAILEKAGFKFIDMMFANAPMQYWRNEWFILNLFKDSKKYILYMWNEKETERVVYIEFVHQLQNLIFAITGTELSINILK